MAIQLEILGYLVLAMFLGGLIGFERERADKPAGLRTHMLVAGSAALLTGLGEVLIPHFGINTNLVQADPIRIIEAVITGISFLGAGTIIRRKAEVEGLTTASSLFFVAALGICIALSQFLVAVGATVIVLLTLRVLKWLENKIDI
jgi:putative Mg2+ transporter-C (MgtC) family protein